MADPYIPNDAAAGVNGGGGSSYGRYAATAPEAAIQGPSADQQAASMRAAAASSASMPPLVPPAPLAPQGAAPQPSAAMTPQEQQLQRESTGARVYHGIMNALGGQYDTQYIPTPNGVVQQQVAQTPGQQWKRIISGALLGLSGAAAAGTTGPGGTMRGLGGGIQAGYQGRMQEEQNKEKLANTQFEQEQNAAMNNARRSLMAAQVAKDSWDLSYAQKQSYEADVAHETNLVNMVNDAKERGGRDLGVFPTFQDAMDHFSADPTMHDKHAQGQLMAVSHVNGKGQIDGVHVAWVPKAWQDQNASQDITFQLPIEWDDKGKPTKYQPVTMGPSTNSTNGQVQDFSLAMANRIGESHKNEVAMQNQESEIKARETMLPAQRAQAVAEAGKSEAEAALEKYNLDFLKQYGELPGKESSKENQEAYYGPGGSSGFNSWWEKRGAPVSDIENSYQVAKTAYDEHATGKDKTGAPGMILFGQHLANTFGGSKAKLNKQLIEDHFGARSLTDDVVVAFQKVTNGEKLSDNQYNEFMRFITDNRNTRWQGLLREATSQHRPLELIGLPNDIAQQYLGAGAGGATGAGGAGGPGTPAWMRPTPRGTMPGTAAPGAGKSVSLSQLKGQAEFKGMTDAQIETAAKNRGYTVTQ